MNDELKNELKSLNSLLSDLPHREYGKTETPSLDGWESKMLNLVKDSAPREAKSVNMWDKMKAPLSVAAMLVVALGFYFMNVYNMNSNEIQALSYTEVADYLEEEELEIEAADSIESIETLSDEEIMNYLQEIEGMDVNIKSGKI